MKRFVSTTWLPALLAAAIFWIWYSIDPNRPGNHPGIGWWGWWDQGAYLRMADALARGALDQGTYQYPLGYPLLGVPFLRLIPDHPFFVPTLLSVCAAVQSLFLIMRRFVPPLEAGAVALAALLAHPLIVEKTLVPPWNNTPVLAAALAVTYLFVVTHPGRRTLIVSAVALPLLFHVRSLEWLLLTGLAVSALALRRAWSDLFRFSAWYAGAFVVSFGLVAWVNLRISGTILPSYVHHVDAIGFFDFPFVPKAYWTIFATDGVVEGSQSLSAHFPWLLLALPGAVVFIRTTGAPAWALVGTIAALLVAYINFDDLWPSMLFRFGNQRYFIWPVSLGLGFAYLTFRQAWRMLPRAVWAALLVAPSLVYTMRLDAAGVYEQVRATHAGDDRLVFELGATDRPIDFVRLYGVTAIGRELEVDVDGRPLEVYKDFFLMDSSDPRHLILARNTSGRIRLRLARDKAEGETLGLSRGRLRWRPRWQEAPIAVREYRLGQTMSFERAESTALYLQEGFSGPEEGYRWSDGKEARIVFSLRGGAAPRLITVSGASYLRQRVRVRINGVDAGDMLFTGGRLEERTLAIPPAAQSEDGQYEIAFGFPDAVRPADKRGDGDTRLLGLAFRWIRLDERAVPAETPLSPG